MSLAELLIKKEKAHNKFYQELKKEIRNIQTKLKNNDINDVVLCVNYDHGSDELTFTYISQNGFYQLINSKKDFLDGKESPSNKIKTIDEFLHEYIINGFNTYRKLLHYIEKTKQILTRRIIEPNQNIDYSDFFNRIDACESSLKENHKIEEDISDIKYNTFYKS